VAEPAESATTRPRSGPWGRFPSNSSISRAWPIGGRRVAGTGVRPPAHRPNTRHAE